MICAIIVLLAVLALSIMANVYMHQQVLEERRRTFEAEEWIDPIALEEDEYEYES